MKDPERSVRRQVGEVRKQSVTEKLRSDYTTNLTGNKEESLQLPSANHNNRQLKSMGRKYVQ